MTNPNAARDVTETAPPPKIPREIWVLVAAAFIIAAGFGLVSPIIPQFARSFDVSTTAASAVVSVFAASRLLFAPASGKLIDLIGSRKVYITGLLTVAVTTGAVAFAQEYWHILAFRAIGGIGSTMFTVSAAGLIVRIAPPSIRGRASSTYATAFLLGSVIGPVAGSGLAVLGMRPPFLIYGVSLILASAVVWKLLRPEVIHDLESHDESTPMLASEAVKNPAYRSALISGFANGWVNFGVRVSTVPLFAAMLFPKGTAVAGMVLAAFAVGNAGCLQFSGRLADSLGRKPLIIAGLIVNATFTGVLGWMDNLWLILLVSVAVCSTLRSRPPLQMSSETNAPAARYLRPSRWHRISEQSSALLRSVCLSTPRVTMSPLLPAVLSGLLLLACGWCTEKKPGLSQLPDEPLPAPPPTSSA